MNIVSTGAMNDIGQLITWENSIESAVPSARRKMRTLAILMRFESTAIAAVALEDIGQQAGNSYIYLAHEIE